MQEEVPLLLAREPVKRQRVVAGDQVGVERRLLAAARNGLQGLRGDREAIADAARLDHDVVRPPDQHLAANRGDHADPTSVS